MKYHKNQSTNDSNQKSHYYNDYIIEENNGLITTYQTNNYTSITLLTIFIFFGSITDVVYSYTQIDTCQRVSYFILLNDWFRINGIFGIIFYFCIIIILYCISSSYQQGYTRLINQNTKTIAEKREIVYKVFLTFNTTIMLLLFSFGAYLFFYHFSELCRSYAITIYMWIRLLSGIVSSIVLLFFINCQ